MLVDADTSPTRRRTSGALVVPRAHAADLMEISGEDLAACAAAARRLAERMRETLEPDGFNVLNSSGAAAWQSVFHFHMHVVPRYADDPLELPWVPQPGEPQEIASVAARIRGDGQG